MYTPEMLLSLEASKRLLQTLSRHDLDLITEEILSTRGIENTILNYISEEKIEFQNRAELPFYYSTNTSIEIESIEFLKKPINIRIINVNLEGLKLRPFFM